jgi:hypothetical protein
VRMRDRDSTLHRGEAHGAAIMTAPAAAVSGRLDLDARIQTILVREMSAEQLAIWHSWLETTDGSAEEELVFQAAARCPAVSARSEA